MDIRSQISMVFHLDKCIGCHTCSIACKNTWTDRKGAEYMWWNNVETKPGTGYPTKWEDQSIYKGGWEKDSHFLKLKGAGKFKGIKNLFHNPNMPEMDDYYEPWTYEYSNLFEAPEGNDQPTARPISLVTGEPMSPKGGPNWDDDLSGTPDYARQDVNMQNVTRAEQEAMFQLEQMTMHYLPRICNHCLNPACVAACPSGAIYKRGEDGIVLVNQDKCRGWRMCVTACPYKKTYYNWNSGKSEKCILCFPRMETGQVPACMHTCVGRIRYLGVLLYDADLIKEVAISDDADLVSNQMEIYLDPNDPIIIKAAKENGISDDTLEAAQKSPVYKFVKEWGLALPLHPEFRTVPNLFYVPPLLPTMGKVEDGNYHNSAEELFGSIENTRLPISYMASLFSAGNTESIKKVLKKLMAVRWYRRDETVGDQSKTGLEQTLEKVGIDRKTADDIYRLTSLPTVKERYVIPPAHREEAVEMLEDAGDVKGNTGFGFHHKPTRGL